MKGKGKKNERKGKKNLFKSITTEMSNLIAMSPQPLADFIYLYIWYNKFGL